MLMKGVIQGKYNGVLYKKYCNKVLVDVALRF
jgi:hypothetical protein